MDNAILMASGLGTRMRPITESTPKPLVAVNGKPMIETVIEGLLRREMRQIDVVVGYLAEQFEYLERKYPKVRIVYNAEYATVNNISSVHAAKDLLMTGEACFICEADLYVSNSSVFDMSFTRSCYYGKFVTGHSNDWVFDIDEAGKITRVGKVGDNCYNMTGVCYLTGVEAALLAGYIDAVYEAGDYENLFWDEIVDQHLDTLNLSVYPIEADDIREIDTIEELQAVQKKLVKSNGA